MPDLWPFVAIAAVAALLWLLGLGGARMFPTLVSDLWRGLRDDHGIEPKEGPRD